MTTRYAVPQRKNVDAHSDAVVEGISAPASFEITRFTLGAEEYLAVSFPVCGEREAEPPDAAPLTQSEREICMLVLAGLSNSEIGRRRGTSPHTIANQVAALYRKLGIGSRRALRARFSPGGRDT